MTVFTSLKVGAGRVGEIQARALANWRTRIPGCEIVTFEGEPPLFAEVVGRVDAQPGRVAMYANADILFSPSVAGVLAWCERQDEDFLVVGRRTDLLPGGQRELHRPSGMDYFIFRKGMFRDLPETRVGRAYYDSALLAYCLRRGIRVVDATDVMPVTHQWHDYGHVAGGRAEIFGGAEAQANKRNNRLRDFGPHIADVKFRFEGFGESEGTGTPTISNQTSLKLVPKRVPLLRRLGLWGLWNRLTRGGLGFWGVHEYMGEMGARFFTRARIIQNFKHSNVVWKFNHMNEWTSGLYTGFDFPCLWYAWRERKRTGEPWMLYLWDPPALSHRDGFPPLRWIIDFVFRWFARRCDHLVLNIHPGLLDEIGFSRVELECWKSSGKLELRMQDAFDISPHPPSPSYSPLTYDFGVLSNWTEAKGGPLMAEALRRLPGRRCLWIGDKGDGESYAAEIVFTGTLPQEQAFAELKKCRVLVAPYLPVRSLKWNYVLKLFEYLQLGRPIVASDNPGNAAVAGKYPGCISLFKSGDVDDLVRALTAAQQSLDA